MPKLFHFEHTRKIDMGDRYVVTHGLFTPFWQDIYYYAMTSRWNTFFAFIGMIFLIINVLFAGLYMLGDHAIASMSPDNFLGAFFFSVETLATVGYGDMHPQTVFGHTVATLEIFTGMSCVALVTGVMFARFSRPRSNVVFADFPVSHIENGRRLLMIRMANARLNVISEAAAKLRLIRDEPTVNAGKFRKLYDLKLEREQHPVFVLGWTLIHVIDETSPLFGLTAESLQAIDAALILSIEGADETTSQTVRARHYYPTEKIRWNHRYVDIFTTSHDQTQHINYGGFHHTEEIDDFAVTELYKSTTSQNLTNDHNRTATL